MRISAWDEEHLEAVEQAYGVYAQKNELSAKESARGYLVDHTAGTFVVGPEGNWRLYFSFGTTSDEILADTKALLKSEEGDRRMTTSQLGIKIFRQEELSETNRAAIISLCSRVYEEDYVPALATFTDATHLLGLVDGVLVSHALWYTRWLQTGNGPLLRTAYVEGVATEEAFRRRGYASLLMERLVGELNAYDLAALSPSRAEFYERLGWELWHGPLSIRTETGLLPTPDYEQVMVYRLPATLMIDRDELLSAEWREGDLW